MATESKEKSNAIKVLKAMIDSARANANYFQKIGEHEEAMAWYKRLHQLEDELDNIRASNRTT